MKFSITKNDKSTAIDEIILGAICIIGMAIGIILIYFKPEIWIIKQHITVVMGVMFVLLSVMFIPSLIYRLLTNDKTK